MYDYGGRSNIFDGGGGARVEGYNCRVIKGPNTETKVHLL